MYRLKAADVGLQQRKVPLPFALLQPQHAFHALAQVAAIGQVGQRVVVSLERKSRRTEDGILILGPSEFCTRLQAGDLF